MRSSVPNVPNNTVDDAEEERIYLSPWRLLMDIGLVMCVGFPLLFLFLWGKPFQRGFFCGDQDLLHPFHESTVPSIYLYLVGIVMNSIVIVFIEFLNPDESRKRIVFLRGLVIPTWLYNAYNILLVFAFGMGCSQLTTDIMKYTIGRLRPHFLTVCRPDVCQSSIIDYTKYHTVFNCTNEHFLGNKRIMKEMRLSFPSGHSSFSMFTMLYFSIYLQKRMTWQGSRLLRHFIQFLALMASIFTAMTRVSDYKHHWSDVLLGLAQGALIACLTARYVSNFFPDGQQLQTDVQEMHQQNPQLKEQYDHQHTV